MSPSKGLRFRQFLTLLVGLLPILSGSAAAEDKSATREGLVKLPSSGGTIQKDESSFDFAASRGTASYSIPLPDLPTRGGMKPNLSLQYNQSSGDGGSGLGIGWSLSGSSISFNDDLGTALHQKRYDNEDFSSHLSLDGQRLIPHLSNQAGQDYVYSLESSSAAVKVRYTKKPQTVEYLGKNGEKQSFSFPGGFIVTASNGQKAYYAEQNTSVENDPARPERVVRWPLTAEVNGQKEAIFYSYTSSGHRSFLREVSFAGGQSVYKFELLKTRSSMISHKAGFAQTNTLLLGGIAASFRNELQSQLCLAYLGRDLNSDAFAVRAGRACSQRAQTDLAPLVSSTNVRSLNVLDQLRTVYRFGRGEQVTDSNMMPKISFDYSNWNESDNQRNIVFPAQSLVQTSAATQFELFDYNLDAIVDLIQADDQNVKIALGTDSLDTSFAQSVSWLLEKDGNTIKPQLGSPAWHFVEMNGDSLTDLVEVEQGRIRVYLRTSTGRFASAETLEIPWLNPSLFASRSLRWIDLNNDGLTDLLSTEIQGSELVWNMAINQTLRTAEGLDYYFLETTQKLPYRAPLANILADDALLLTDVNGDQLIDLVRVRPDRGGICIYENQGDVYADPTSMLFGDTGQDVLGTTNCDKGRFIQVDGLSSQIQNGSRRIWFMDANGDGILDLTSFTADDSRMKVWLGFGTGDFLQNPLQFSTLDREGRAQISVQSGRERTRIADIDGDGQTELVIFQAGIPGLKPVVVIDFNRLAQTQLVKSNLLTTIENATGLRHDLRYASSIDELLRDRQQGRTTRALHFPMYVVKQLVTSEADPLNPGQYKEGREVKEMLYHQPVYDPWAKKLVGFQSVETITYGDEFKRAEEMTQLSSYHLEVYASDYRLAGRLQESYVHEYTPTGTFEEESAHSNNLSWNDITVHSMKNYTQGQEAAAPGRLLSSAKYSWALAELVDGYDGDIAYFVRQNSQEDLYYGSSGAPAAVRKTFSDFDAYNIPQVIDETRDAIQGPQGLSIPARSIRQVIRFEPARSQLAQLEILSAPSKVENYRLDGTQQELIASTEYEYTGQGQVRKQTELALYDRSRVKSEVKAPFDSVSEKTYDAFGNPLTSSINGVLLETVVYDGTGTFPIEQRNAIGQSTRLYYGTESMEACAGPVLDVQEGLLKGYKDTRDVCHSLAYDQFGRRTLYQRDDGYEERYQYHFAENGTPSRILKSMRRYTVNASRPVGELEWVHNLDAWTPAGARVASLEVLEEGNGVRVNSYEEHNRKKNSVRVYTPYKDLDTSLTQVFESGIIPTAGRGAFTLTRYDALNRPVQRIYPTGRVEQHRFEPWGQVQTSTYNKGGEQGTTTVSKTIVQLGKQVFAIIDERAGVYRYVYDVYDNITEVWMPGQTQARSYVYSSLDQKLQQCTPDLGCSIFEYDKLGQLAVRTNFDAVGKKTSTLQFYFDVLGRLQELYDNDRLITRNQYDRYPNTIASGSHASAIGLLTVSQSFDEHRLYDETKVLFYDRPGRVVERRTELSGVQLRSFVEKFKFTLDGALLQAEDPFQVKSHYRLSPTLRFTHLEMELPWQPGTREVIVDKVNYNAKGQVEQIAYRQGSYTNLAYDLQTLLLTQIESSYRKADGNQEFLQFAALDFDGNGSVVSIDDNVPANTSFGQVNRSAKLTYNERDELIRAERYGETQEFDYDEAGNFTRNTELGSTLVANSRKLLPPGSQETSYVFDRSGQLKSRKSTAVVRSSDPLHDLQKRRQIVDTRFNGLGQLIYVKTEKQEIFFGYNAEGVRSYKRVKEIGGMQVADSLFPSKSVIVEPSGAQSFVFIGDRRISRIEHPRDLSAKGQWYYYILDHLGSTDFTMQANGTPIEQMLYRAYGTEVDINQLAQGVTWKQHQQNHQSLMPKERTHHRFTGQYLDDDSGLYYYGTRYYDPLLGRFISADDTFLDDPENCIERPLECNAYGYAANNPLKYTDPNGKWAHIFVGAVVGAVIGGAADAIFNPNSNWKTVAAAAGGGAVSGGLAAATGGASLAAQTTTGAIATGVGVGAVSAGVGNTVQQGINIASGEQKQFSGRQLGMSMAIGGAMGGATAGVARAIRAPNPAGGLCFAKGTPVATPKGLVPIEDIQEGDLVYAYDVDMDTPTIRRVTASLRGMTSTWIDIQVDSDEIIRATPSHPIWLPLQRQWIAAERLVAGHVLQTLEGRFAEVTAVQRIKLATDEDTYNFSVEKDADYFVGKTSFLVHNNTPPSLPDKVLVNEGGVRIWHNYGNNTAAPPGTPIEHRPIHYHVTYKGTEYRIQASGRPVDGSAKPPQAVLDAFKERRSFFNRMDGRISQWLNRVASGPKGGKCG